ncbi:MAG TPA: NAD(P)H-dependent oxidoreductase [Salinimicrobium sp.]|nr:NAD(P)H-dependent oxidoreductase [Salinimicrobium sp.]
MYNLKVIIASTRPGRKGPLVADWFLNILKEHREFGVEVLDLKEIGLPFLDEPNHPRLKQYTKEHTKKWSKTIDSGDAFVVVTPEYNYGFPATIKNALDFLYQEWRYKPMAFVSYGGLSGGIRAVQMLKQVVTTLNMVPVTQAVNIPFFSNHIKEGKFEGNEMLEKSANTMIDELLRWTKAMKTMRV